MLRKVTSRRFPASTAAWQGLCEVPQWILQWGTLSTPQSFDRLIVAVIRRLQKYLYCSAALSWIAPLPSFCCPLGFNLQNSLLLDRNLGYSA
jgi:hypothetical protein